MSTFACLNNKCFGKPFLIEFANKKSQKIFVEVPEDVRYSLVVGWLLALMVWVAAHYNIANCHDYKQLEAHDEADEQEIRKTIKEGVVGRAWLRKKN